MVLNVHRDGRVVRRTEFGARAYHVNFMRDGSLLFGEHVVGASIKPEIQARMKTTIPFARHLALRRRARVALPSRRHAGEEYATAVHGGMGGFLGVTMSALAPDDHTLVYCSRPARA